jgi:hypothetical protein
MVSASSQFLGDMGDCRKLCEMRPPKEDNREQTSLV